MDYMSSNFLDPITSVWTQVQPISQAMLSVREKSKRKNRRRNKACGICRGINPKDLYPKNR